MQIISNLEGYSVLLQPGTPAFKSHLSAIKRIKGVKFDGAKKIWNVPKGNYSTQDDLISYLIGASKRDQVLSQADTIQVQPMPELEVQIPLKKTMYPFQEQGVAYNLLHRRVLIGDQQGLGKTIQLAATVKAAGEFPGLIICKNALRMNWLKEIEEWTDLRPTIFTPSIQHTWPHLFETGFYDIGIVNYDSLQKYFVKSVNVPPDEKFRLQHITFYNHINLFKWIAVDESHYVKDSKTMRTKITAGLSKGKGQVYLLSGTPALNNPMELYTQLCILGKQGRFGKEKDFKAMFCGKKNRHNLARLNTILRDECFYRRTKDEVFQDMPEKTRQVILCDIDNRPEYDKAAQEFKKYLEENLAMSGGQITQALRSEALVRMNHLRRITGRGKLPAVKDWLESVVEQGEKVVMFAHHRDVQADVAKMVPGTVRLGSGQLPETIQRNKEQFQADDTTMVIVCSNSADSEGHTLTRASNMGIVETPWTWGKAEQMEDRIHRIGTKFPCNYAYFIADNTIDRHIYNLVMDKKEMHDLITGTEEQITVKTVDLMINLFTQKIR